ncbi:MAG: hypothetical protein COA73_13075 [Candidatus Hydrogenedentota bacterium]|nr:MAG: hypothetical protein COA73_13075 [Candidatus Hydrogenedentota bacterium]
MKDKMMWSIALVILMGFPVSVSAATPFDGGWDIMLKMRGQERPAKLVIKDKDGALSGLWISPRGKDKLQNVKVENNMLRFDRTMERQNRKIVLKHEVKLNDGKLVGNIITPRGERPFRGKRANNDSDQVIFNRDQREGRGGGGEGRSRGPGGEGRPSFSEIVSRFDANGDGKLQKSEAPERMLAHFDRLDSNGDGAVDPEEGARISERPRQKGRP